MAWFAPINVQLSGTPMWIVAASTARGNVWVVAHEDGQLEGFRQINHEILTEPIEPSVLPAGAPPVILADERVTRLIVAPDTAASKLTHPMPLPRTGGLSYVDNGGDLVFHDGETERERIPLGLIPDARILRDEADRLIVLTDATSRYAHGILGDEWEGGGVAVVETDPEIRVAHHFEIPAPGVVEGIAPIWADMDGDGTREVVLTISDAEVGARLEVFAESGELLASGPAIGQGHRWRHAIAVAPFAEGLPELADVLTPHLGRTTEFFGLESGTLALHAETQGPTSHFIGSRNLDMGLAGDWDGDGQGELMLVDRSRQALVVVDRTNEGASLAQEIDLGGILATNLAAAVSPAGGVTLGAGRDDGILRLWGPGGS